MNSSVVAEGLTKRIGEFTAVDHVSFSVRQGEIFGFLGSNGAGKTTTIRMLCGIILPTEGRASILGLDIVRDRNRIKQIIGYMSQKFSLYEDLTVRENLQFFSGMYNVSNAAAGIDEALETTGLRSRAGTITANLPFGLKQRLALASAMLHRPRIIFLDEPTAGVDPSGRRAFWEIIHKLADEGITVFVTTHYMDEAEYCNRITLMDRGRLKAVGSPAELKREAMRGTMLEIRCDNPAAALGAIRRAELGETALFGKTIHLNVPEEASGRARATGVLAEAGIGVAGIDVVTPSLEDVFLSVLRQEEETA